MFYVQFISPYTQQTKREAFTSRAAAHQRAEFYRSCGTRATVVG